MDREVLLTVPELAEFLRVSVKTLQRWRQTGGGPDFFKRAGVVTYRMSVVMEWIKQNEYKSTSDFTVRQAQARSS
jgi:predicted site-specific integrase-resolvase